MFKGAPTRARAVLPSLFTTVGFGTATAGSLIAAATLSAPTSFVTYFAARLALTIPPTPLSGSMAAYIPTVTAPDAIGPHHLSLIHISEPTRLGMISYAVFCLKNKKH